MSKELDKIKNRLPALLDMYAADLDAGFRGTWYLLRIGLTGVQDMSEEYFHDTMTMYDKAGMNLPLGLPIPELDKMYHFAKALSELGELGIAAFMGAVGIYKNLEADVMDGLVDRGLYSEPFPYRNTGLSTAEDVPLRLGDKVLLYGVPGIVAWKQGAFGIDCSGDGTGLVPWQDIMKASGYNAADGKYNAQACLDNHFVSFWELAKSTHVSGAPGTILSYVQAVPDTALSQKYGIEFLLPSQQVYKNESLHTKLKRVSITTSSFCSFPVIRRWTRKWDSPVFVLATFTTAVSPNQITAGIIWRPDGFALSDLRTGRRLYDTYCTGVKEFSSASKGEEFPIGPNGNLYRPLCDTEETDMFALLDKARCILLASGDSDNQEFRKTYQQYLDIVTSITPPSYQRFYKELSI